jgi:hypothetical protein
MLRTLRRFGIATVAWLFTCVLLGLIAGVGMRETAYHFGHAVLGVLLLAGLYFSLRWADDAARPSALQLFGVNLGLGAAALVVSWIIEHV